MRKILYSLIFCTLACWMASCDQDIDFAYEGKARIQFQHYTTDWNGNRHYADTLAITYGLLPDSITIDTAKVVIEFLGSPSDQAKTYYVSVVEDSTTAIAGTHYEPIAHEQTFRPNELTDAVRIVVFLSDLSNVYINPEDYQLYLQLEASPDFDLGLNGGLIKKIKLNNYMSEPDWWYSNTGLGFFHPKKWQILISFNEEYANQHTCPFDTNNEGKEYARGLSNYLNAIPTYDDATGMRIYMNGLEEE